MKTSYVVIEQFGGNPVIITNPEDGTARIFDDLSAAQAEAEECQDGIVVPLMDVISLLSVINDRLREHLGFELSEIRDVLNQSNP